MNSWIFYFTDSLNTVTAVVGAGTSMEEAKTTALAKWDTFASGRPDYTDRAPVVDVIDAELTTLSDSDDMPGLIL